MSYCWTLRVTYDAMLNPLELDDVLVEKVGESTSSGMVLSMRMRRVEWLCDNREDAIVRFEAAMAALLFAEGDVRVALDREKRSAP